MRAKNYIKRTIAAAHYLPGYEGPCAKVHGHTWLVEVWIAGEVDQETGMVIDFKTIKKVIDRFDHSFLNEQAPFKYGTLSPTSENLAGVLYERINVLLRGNCEVRVRVWESQECWSEVRDGYEV